MLATRAPSRLKYDEALESALSSIENLLKGNYRLSRRAVGLLLLQGDSEMEGRVREQEDANYQSIQKIVSEAKAIYSQPLSYIIALRQQQEVRRILEAAVTSKERPRQGFAEWLSRAMMNPASGSLILLVVLYLGFYQVVGVLGAGTLVDFIEGTVFGEWINPWVANLAVSLIPFKVIQELFVGESGIITLGFTYAFALILPIVGTFFIVFSIIEDSGYLPRLAMLIDRVFKRDWT